MQTKHTVRIVLSFPSDVEDECRVMEGVIAELNRGVAHERRVVLELIHWKTDAYPGFHSDGPQGVIDPILKIEDCDILLAIFWKRFGTPAKGALSGAEHEIRTAIKARQDAGQPHIMIYFKEAARELKTPEELRQYASVLEFKQEISPLGLFWTFEETADFERKVRQHLTHYILDHIHPIPQEGGTVSAANRVQEESRQFAHAVDEINPRTGKENLNQLGLANMLGNVWEWCQDWYDNYKTPARKDEVVENPPGPKTGVSKIRRGGSFYNQADALRCARRNHHQPVDRYDDDGFRLVSRESLLIL